MNSNWFKIIMKSSKVEYGKGVILKGVPIVFNKRGARLTIGDNVIIKSSFLSNMIGLYQRTIIVTRTPEAEIVIGNNVGISGATIYARNSVRIGDRTVIGGNVKIIDNDFHPIEADKRNELMLGVAPEVGERSEWIGTKPVVIGRDCFIGTNSIILKGTILGDGCVVGAGAVVSGKFEDNCVIVGNPGKVVKRINN